MVEARLATAASTTMALLDKEPAVRKPRSTALWRRLARASGDQQCGMAKGAAQPAARIRTARRISRSGRRAQPDHCRDSAEQWRLDHDDDDDDDDAHANDEGLYDDHCQDDDDDNDDDDDSDDDGHGKG